MITLWILSEKRVLKPGSCAFLMSTQPANCTFWNITKILVSCFNYFCFQVTCGSCYGQLFSAY